MKILEKDTLPAPLTVSAWNKLSEVTLTQLILFKRRRQGQVSKMKLADLEKKTSAQPETYSCLSKVEKELCKLFDGVEVDSKRKRSVQLSWPTRTYTIHDMTLHSVFNAPNGLPVRNARTMIRWSLTDQFTTLHTYSQFSVILR